VAKEVPGSGLSAPAGLDVASRPLASASIALGRRPAGKLANRLGAARLVSLDADSVTV
jgi:hypothetical protein